MNTVHLRYILKMGICAALAFSLMDDLLPVHEAKANTGGQTRRELWTGSLYSSTYRAGVCLAPDGNLRGVLLLRLRSGKVDVYHFFGTMDDKGSITLRHNDGHVFKGAFEDDTTVSGQITLKSGFRVRLSGARVHDVQLTETCRPLPE